MCMVCVDGTAGYVDREGVMTGFRDKYKVFCEGEIKIPAWVVIIGIIVVLGWAAIGSELNLVKANMKFLAKQVMILVEIVEPQVDLSGITSRLDSIERDYRVLKLKTRGR